MIDKNTYKAKFEEIINSQDTSEQIRSVFSCCIDNDNPDIGVWSYLFEIKDDISPDLAVVFSFFLQRKAKLKWFMLITTVYDEKIEDPMCYMELIEQGFENGLDIEFLDDCQKNTSDFKGFEKMVSEKMNFSDGSAEVEVSDQNPVHSFEISSIQQDNDSLKALLDSHIKELSSLRMENMELQKECFDLRKSSLSLESEMQSLKKDYEQSKKDNQHLLSANKLSSMKIISIQKLCDTLKKVNTGLLFPDMEIAENKIKESEEMYHMLEEEFASMKSKYEASLETNAVLESQLSSLRNDKHELDKKYQALVLENKETELRCRELYEELEKVKSQLITESHDRPSDEEIRRFEEADNDDYTDDFIREMNEELRKDTSSIMNDIEEDDFDQSELISMISDKQEIKKHRSLFRVLLDKFRDREFTRMPAHEQKGMIFTKMVEKEFPKPTIKLVSETLKANKKMKRVELYRLISQNASPDECERYCKAVGAA